MANIGASYKEQQIMTSSPEELTLLLYNGAIRFINESITAMDIGNLQEAHNANLRAQKIVNEFMMTLDMQYEISKTWLSLYEYILYCLFQGNIKKDRDELLKANLLLTELREAWTLAMKKVSSMQVITDTTDAPAKKLWMSYLSLTKKMMKCLSKQEMGAFYECVNQRKQLQTDIDQMAYDDFKSSEEGKRIVFEIQSNSHFIANMLQAQISDVKQPQVMKAYDNTVDTAVSHRHWQR